MLVFVTNISYSERNKHHNERSTGVGGTSGISHPTTSSTSRMDPTSTSTGGDHHLGRDAGVGAGGVGAAGLGEQ